MIPFVTYTPTKNWKQCVQINNKQSEFDTAISVPQGRKYRNRDRKRKNQVYFLSETSWSLYELNFNEHINKICKSAGNQLNELIRIKSFSGLQEKKVLVNSFIYPNFGYCRLIWMLSHKNN